MILPGVWPGARGLFMRTRGKTLKRTSQGARGVPNFFFKPNLILFVTYNSVHNFITLGQPLLGEKYVAEKKEKKKNTKKGPPGG